MEMASHWKAQYRGFALSVQRNIDGSWDISALRGNLKIRLETTEFDELEAQRSAACLAFGYMRDMEGDTRPFLEQLSWQPAS